jgi:ankyrin repeat protein
LGKYVPEQTPLTAAIELGLEHCVEALLIAGANANLPDESKKSPLMLATTFGFQRGVELLLKFGADPNVRCYTAGSFEQEYPIQEAADKPEIRAILLAAGARFHAPRPPPDPNQACQIL